VPHWKFARWKLRFLDDPKNIFGGKESRSGEGSSLLQTANIRREIPRLLKELNIETMLDAPCGDLFWIKEVDLPVKEYIGIDIVEDLIIINNKKHKTEQRSFLELNIIENVIPKADLIFCRDCLVHLSFDQCRKVINNLKKSGSIYLLTTTFTERSENEELNGIWRTLNLEKPPFNFPTPLQIINENCTEYNGDYSDKSLGLWRLEDINLY